MPQIQTGICKDCGGTLIERGNGKTGVRFLGCSNDPSCWNTCPLPEEESVWKDYRYLKRCEFYLRKRDAPSTLPQPSGGIKSFLEVNKEGASSSRAFL